jgi:predicted amidophosphoribosyltransferase
VDDVCTTGSTLSALAKAAKARGADVVCAFVAAHVPPIR